MELRHLRYFVAVAEEENVSRAALRLHVSQPALSRQIRDLEDELGFPLFERSAKSVRLTPAGGTFLGEARAVLERTDAAVRTARAVATRSDGELHVGYAPTPTARILPPALRAFQAERPGIRVKLHDLSTEEMLAGLRQRQLHLAVLVQPTRGMLRGLRFTPVWRDAVRLAVARGHPLARARSVPLGRLAAERLIVYAARSFPEYHAFLSSVFGRTKATPQIAEEHESGASLIAAVEAGYGVALATESMACAIGQRLKLIPLEPEPLPFIVGVSTPATPTRAAEQFLQALLRAAASL